MMVPTMMVPAVVRVVVVPVVDVVPVVLAAVVNGPRVVCDEPVSVVMPAVPAIPMMRTVSELVRIAVISVRRVMTRIVPRRMRMLRAGVLASNDVSRLCRWVMGSGRFAVMTVRGVMPATLVSGAFVPAVRGNFVAAALVRGMGTMPVWALGQCNRRS
jgi:hypothetical protein